jgi:hypothetical protein
MLQTAGLTLQQLTSKTVNVLSSYYRKYIGSIASSKPWSFAVRNTRGTAVSAQCMIAPLAKDRRYDVRILNKRFKDLTGHSELKLQVIKL